MKNQVTSGKSKKKKSYFVDWTDNWQVSVFNSLTQGIFILNQLRFTIFILQVFIALYGKSKIVIDSNSFHVHFMPR